MARKNPLGKIKDAADVAVLTVVGTVTETVKDPIGTGQKVVGRPSARPPPRSAPSVAKVGGRKRLRGPERPTGTGRRTRRTSRARPRATR